MSKNKIGLIIPTCSDLNRGDQALVLETMRVMKKTMNIENIYMMSNKETSQCEAFGLKTFKDILKHPSRFTKHSNNIKYNRTLKLKWGIIATFDFLFSVLLLNKFTRNITKLFADKDTKNSLNLYEKADAIFVKGGGFMHDYSGGLVGRYIMYYQVFHIKLALSMKKKVFIMPNSFGPFKNKKNIKFLNKLLDKCQFISARESISANGNSNGLKRNIELYPDLGFFLQTNIKERDNIKKYLTNKYNMNFNKEKYIAITARPYRFYESDNPELSKKIYIEAFSHIAKDINDLGFIPVFVVHTRAENAHENDEICIDEIIEQIEKGVKYIKVKDDNLTCVDLKNIYSLCEAIIGTRFHSVIFSLANLVPAIAITYGGNKGQGIMRDMGLQDYAIKIEELNYTKLYEKLNLLLNHKEEQKKKIQEYLNDANDRYNIMLKKIQRLGE